MNAHPSEQSSGITARLTKMASDLWAFDQLGRVIALICILIPLMLYLADDQPGFRSSISDYVYMRKSYIYGMLLTAAGMLFTFNGVVYINKKEEIHRDKRHGRWYNIVLGLSLIGVVIFPYKEYMWVHYGFAIVFFLGSAVVIALFTDPKHRRINRWIAAATLASFVLLVIDRWLLKDISIISILVAEWISLFVIAIHYILESKGLIS